MQSLRTWSKGLSAAACLCGTLAMAQEASQEPTNAVPAVPARIQVAPSGVVSDPDQPNNTLEVFVTNPTPNAAAGAGLVVYSDPGAAQAEPGKYWVGLLCVDAGEALRQQLSLEDGVGLIVESVTDEAPAKKAGIQKHDVLLSVQLPSDDSKAEPRSLKGVMALIESVQRAETKPLKLTLLRRGQKQTIEVTPAERPQTPVTLQVQRFGPAEQQLHAVLEAQREQSDAQANHAHRAITALRMAGPMYLPPQQQAPKLPEGMSLEFRQVVGQPTRIFVSKGDQKWEIGTLEELQKLPADVRGVVERQIAFQFGAVMAPGAIRFTATQPMAGAVGFVPAQPTTVAIPTTVHVESRATSGNLPDDLSVSVTKKGSEPARITVKKGEQSWEITEKELDKLPDDVRKHVEAAINPIHSRVPGFGARPLTAWPSPTPNEQQLRYFREALRPENQVRPQMSPPSSPTNQLQERQEAMLKQLQALTEKVEKLQQALEKSTPKQ